ncbi:Multidrug resistance-associated protein 1 [Geranomyces michiganensis]|nr:Multidrug resistance-associated protein 1 [Geranomyces michiganensis]
MTSAPEPAKGKSSVAAVDPVHMLSAPAPPTQKRMGTSNVFSFVAVSWLSPLMRQGFKKPLTFEDLPLMAKNDEAAVVTHVLDGYRAATVAHLANPATNPKASLARTLARAFWVYFVGGVICELLAAACILLSPLLIEQVLVYVLPAGRQRDASILWIDSGVGLSFILFALQIGSTVFQKTSEQLLRQLLIKLRSLLIATVYEKSLRMSAATREEFSAGKIANLISVDAEQIAFNIVPGAVVFSAPAQIITASILLIRALGVSAWAALGLMVALLLIQVPLMISASKFLAVVLKYADDRIKTIREVLYTIKIIKLRAMEQFFTNKIQAVRAKQLAGLRIWYTLFGAAISIAVSIPLLLPISAFLVYSAVQSTMDPTKIFPALVLFQVLFTPLLTLPEAISSLAQCVVSYKRIAHFLASSEAQPLLIEANSESENAIVITVGTFEWAEIKNEEKKKKLKKQKKIKKVNKAADINAPTASELGRSGEETAVQSESDLPAGPLFRDLNLKIRKGLLTAVVGPVGSGKSSLFSAIIGEMTQLKGTVHIHGNLAFCQQTPWIQTATVKENILFGNAFDAARLRKVVKMCSLEADIAQLGAGIETEIGEKGVNLSGGQQARLALARAVYNMDIDIYLLDDPISALDAEVGADIFNDCLKNGLAGKTRVLVTHHLHLMPEVDRIIVLEEGRIAEEGTYTELMAAQGVLAKMMKDHQTDNSEDTDGEDEKAKTDANTAAERDEDDKDASASGGLIAVEDQIVGAVEWDTYKRYIDAAGGWVYTVVLLTCLAMQNVATVMSSCILTWWTEDRWGWSHQQYRIAYGLVGAVASLATVMTVGCIMVGTYAVARFMHNAALTAITRAPLGWFDTQPIGRIINRFSGDIESLDFNTWGNVTMILFGVAGILSSLVLMAIVQPYTLLLFAPILVVYWYILRFYRASFRELKRINSTKRSPLASHITETLAGLPSIRAYKVEDKFCATQRALLDASAAPLYLQLTSSVWISLRLEMSVGLIVLLLALLGTQGLLTPSLLGLVFSYAVPLASNVNMCLNAIAYLEANMNAVERLSEYIYNLPQEAAPVLDTDPKLGTWPTAGAIAIRDLELRYPSRPDHAVLRNITVDIRAGEKIGIIGRTGSGKSTLLTALFRLVELSKGTITIDGRDISTLGLKTLRKGLQIIPQQPVMFQGTIRDNLNLEGTCTDTQVWDALDRVGLKKYVAGLPAKLEAPVAVNGENLSQGQAQLMSLGRAVLIPPAILFLDEASSSVDAAADLLIQASLKTQFKNVTIMSIAHRLNTIVDFDRVLVLDDGEVAEFDTPHALLSKDSLFSKLADATGPANARMLRDVAAEVEKARVARAVGI